MGYGWCVKSSRPRPGGVSSMLAVGRPRASIRVEDVSHRSTLLPFQHSSWPRGLSISPTSNVSENMTRRTSATMPPPEVAHASPWIGPLVVWPLESDDTDSKLRGERHGSEIKTPHNSGTANLSWTKLLALEAAAWGSHHLPRTRRHGASELRFLSHDVPPPASATRTTVSFRTGLLPQNRSAHSREAAVHGPRTLL